MANVKVTALAEATSISTDDLFMIIDDPSGSDANKKATFTNVVASIPEATTEAKGLMSTADKLRLVEPDQYNVTSNIPLSEGSYYTSQTAREAVPAGLRKNGMSIKYETAAGVWLSETFKGNVATNWASAYYWQKSKSQTLQAEVLSTLDIFNYGVNLLNNDERLWEVGSLDASGAAIVSVVRLRTNGFIPVDYRKIYALTLSSGYEIKLFFYDSNYSYLGVSDAWLTSSSVTITFASARYIKAIIRTPADDTFYNDSISSISPALVSSSVVNQNVFNDAVKAVRITDVSNNVFDPNGLLELGSLSLTTGAELPSTTRLRTSEFIELKKTGESNESITIRLNNASWNYAYLFYDENETFISSSGVIYLAVDKTVFPPATAKYVKFSFRNVDRDSNFELLSMLETFNISFFYTSYLAVNTKDELSGNISLADRKINDVTQSLDNYKNNIFLNPTWEFKTISSLSETEQTARTRLLSSAYEVKSHTKYYIINDDSTSKILIVAYDLSLNVLRIGNYGDLTFTTRSNEKYIKVLYKKTVDEVFTTASMQISNIIIKEAETQAAPQLLPHVASEWYNGSYDSSGAETTNDIRLRTKKAKLRDNISKLNFVFSDSSYQYIIVTWDKDGDYIGVTSYYTSSGVFYLTPEVGYYALICKNPAGTTIATSEASSFTTVLNANAITENGRRVAKAKIKVATFNFGIMNNGAIPIGMPDEDVDTELPNWKAIITNLEADILFVTEYNNYLDQSGTRSTYTELLEQFYPHKYTSDLDGITAIFSKQPFFARLYKSPDLRNHLIGSFYIGDEIIGIACVHPLSGESESASRIADHESIIAYMSAYDKAIVAGDFNTWTVGELDDYVAAGYRFGNWGYFGTLNTYPGRAFDNIIAKNIIINNFTVGAEKATSDHYPVSSDLII